MSYARWSSDSDIYLFQTVEGKYECCAYMLAEIEWDSHVMNNIQETIEHVNEHISVGHKVPQYAIDRLYEERNK